MKKILFAAMAAIFACGLNAENAVRVHITSPENSRTDYVYIQEDPSFSATSQDVEEAPKFMNTAPNLNIYAVAPYGNMAVLNTNDVEGVVLAFTTNSRTNYKLTFDMQAGDAFYLKDNVENKLIEMVPATVYEFTATANTTVADRFSITKVAPLADYLFIGDQLTIGELKDGTLINFQYFTYVDGKRVNGIDGTNPNKSFKLFTTEGYCEISYTNKAGVARKFIVNPAPVVTPANN